MMDALWLAVCGDEVQAERCRAAVRRSGGGRVLWVGDGPAAERLASCAADAGEKPRLVACDTLDGLDALAVAARRQGINLVVLADAADPSRTMGLFQRGVQEVIADSATGGRLGAGACGERAPAAPHAKGGGGDPCGKRMKPACGPMGPDGRRMQAGMGALEPMSR